MWTRVRLLGLGLLAFGLVGLGAASASSIPGGSGSSGGCSVHYTPILACAVPQGGTLDPCAIATAGVAHCSFTLPDFNPVDWFNYVGCSFVQILTNFGAYVSSGLSGILNGIAAAVNGLATGFVAVINGITSAFNGIGAAAGPLSPVVTFALYGLLIVAGVIGLYFATVLLFAIAKTIFNLL